MTTTMKLAMGILVTAGLALAAPGATSAQEQIGCFRGKPLPDCKTFWIVEMQGVVPIVQSTRTVSSGSGPDNYIVQVEAFDNAVEWNVGHMVNLGAGYAVGGVLTVGTGGYDPLTGLRVRGRKWLGPDLSLELETGLLSSDVTYTTNHSFNGWTSDLRLNIRDQGSFFVRYDRVSAPAQSYPYNDYFDPGGVHHGFSFGASAGSVPALVGTGALGILYAVLIGLYLTYD